MEEKINVEKNYRLMLIRISLILIVFLCSFQVFSSYTFTYADSSDDIIVHRTKTGSKYHREGCSYLKSDIPITLTEAINKGLTPCSRCNPPVANTENESKKDSNSSNKKNAKASTKVKQENAENADVKVYYADTGTVYHRKDCTYLISSNETTLYIACVEKKLGRCSRCHPPILGEPSPDDEEPYKRPNSSSNSSSSSKSSSSSSSSSKKTKTKASDTNNTKDANDGFPYEIAGGIGAVIIGSAAFSAINKKRREEKEEEERIKKEEELKQQRNDFIDSLNGKRIRDVAGVPSHLYFYEGLPKDNNNSKYGNFTVYISPNGSRYHQKRGCSSASIPIHSFKAINSFVPCSKCCSTTIRAPEWFVKYSSLVEKARRLQIDRNDPIFNLDATARRVYGVDKEAKTESENNKIHYNVVRRERVNNTNQSKYSNIKSRDGKIWIEVDNKNKRIDLFFSHRSYFEPYRSRITPNGWRWHASRYCWYNYLSDYNYKTAVDVIKDHDD